MTQQPQTKPWWRCRRTILSLYGMTLLFVLGITQKEQVGPLLVTIVVAVAGANASEAILSKNNAKSSEIAPPR